VDLWHRKAEWKLNALDPRENTAIARVTPRENPAVNGPWICNKGRDLAQIFERPRAQQALLKGQPAPLADAIAAARRLIGEARRPAALVSNWGSNEELAAFKAALGDRLECIVKSDWHAMPGERLEDDLLIRADKNPNTRMAHELFGAEPRLVPVDADLVLVWGEGASFANLPRGVKVVLLGSYLAPENGHAEVFIPVSIQTERAGHYTNFAGVVSRFEPIVRKKDGVAHAEQLFAQLAATAEAIA
jgi:NADH-quinone oxidoreductase subunit G